MRCFIYRYTCTCFILLSLALLITCTTGCDTRPTGTASTPFTPSVWNGDPVVATASGYVKGLPAKDETWVWKAVPYARPPVGDLRWKAPVEPVPWTGVRTKHHFCSQCLQFNPVCKGIMGKEDCLYLNIWRPKTSETTLPVYVWIHGGGNSLGSATMVPSYYGHALASGSNMVFISFNYRLGPFGWFSHPALQEGRSPEDDSGNFGTLDLIMALKWIQKNIRAFGGDPENVIVTGESAGGINIFSLLISPLAEGLFSQAMCQSGFLHTSSPKESQRFVHSIMVQLLMKEKKAVSTDKAERMIAAMSDEEIRSLLKGKSGKEIMKVLTPELAGMINMPNIFTDGYVLPEAGYSVLDTGDYPNKVPLILGTNEEEMKLFLSFTPGLSWKSDLYQAVGKYGSLMYKVQGADGPARRLTRNPDQPPVYVYLFSWGSVDSHGESPLPGNAAKKLGAFHTMEIPFFLGTDTLYGPFFLSGLFNKKNRPGRKALSAAMMQYVSDFTRTGNPSPPGSSLPLWKPWTNAPGEEKYIIFDVDENRPAITMSSEEVTQKEIEDDMRAHLDAQMFEKVMEWNVWHTLFKNK